MDKMGIYCWETWPRVQKSETFFSKCDLSKCREWSQDTEKNGFRTKKVDFDPFWPKNRNFGLQSWLVRGVKKVKKIFFKCDHSKCREWPQDTEKNGFGPKKSILTLLARKPKFGLLVCAGRACIFGRKMDKKVKKSTFSKIILNHQIWLLGIKKACFGPKTPTLRLQPLRASYCRR